MNVYRFSTKGKEPKIVVAPDVATASSLVNFEWETIKCVYKNVTVVDNG
jgi:hypothetical protein